MNRRSGPGAHAFQMFWTTSTSMASSGMRWPCSMQLSSVLGLQPSWQAFVQSWAVPCAAAAVSIRVQRILHVPHCIARYACCMLFHGAARTASGCPHAATRLCSNSAFAIHGDAVQAETAIFILIAEVPVFDTEDNNAPDNCRTRVLFRDLVPSVGRQMSAPNRITQAASHPACPERRQAFNFIAFGISQTMLANSLNTTSTVVVLLG